MRKTIFCLVAAAAVFASCGKKEADVDANAVESVQTDGKYPEMTFTEEEFDFGDIKQGEKVSHEFIFENTGEAELLISKAKGSCGCTVPEYTKDAIAPGGSGTIKVTFNSAGKHGKQHKTITLSTNTKKGKELLHVKTNINSGNNAN